MVGKNKGEKLMNKIFKNSIVLNLKYINSLLEKEKQTRRIQDAQELLKFVIWKLQKNEEVSDDLQN